MSPISTTAILLHGLCSTPDELLPVNAALSKAGHGVVPLRVAGYTFDPSPAGRSTTSHAQWIHAVANAARAEQAQGRRVVLVGLSAGATLALAALLYCAEAVHGMVLMSTPLKYDGWAVPRHHVLMPLALYTPLGRFWQYRERPPYGVKNERVRRWIEREMNTRRVSSAGAAVIGVPHLREHDRLRRLVIRHLATLRCPPVLALHAQEDEVASPANVARLQATLRTTSFRSVLLPDSHHMISIDNDREAVARETVSFIDAVAAAHELRLPSQ